MEPDRSEETKPLVGPVKEPNPAPELQSPDPVVPTRPPDELETLPESYGETKVVLLPVGPYIAHCYWEVTPKDLETAKQTLGAEEWELWPALRFHDVTNSAPDDVTIQSSFDVQVQLQANNWYVRCCNPDRAYCADLALKGEDGSFLVLARSNIVQMPPAMPSTHADELWQPIRLQSDPSIDVPRQTPPVEPVVGPPALDGSGTLKPEAKPEMPSATFMPVDMAADVRDKLSELYTQRACEDPAPPHGHSFCPSPYAASELSAGSPVLSELAQLKSGPSPSHGEMRWGVAVDITELNERSFGLGISSKI